jgi:hypothetical protein
VKRFYLGTHEPIWLRRLEVPLFVSHRRLVRLEGPQQRAHLPRAIGRWALDSGGFSELSMYGEWRTTPQQYAHAIGRYHDEIGKLDWAAPQDWMCEPFMLAKTGLSTAEHQARTIESFLHLNATVYGVNIIPVLQGWTLSDYVDHIEQYRRQGIDLAKVPLVGLGSVCRRQATTEITTIVTELASYGLQLHGFGIKMSGLTAYGQHLASADSMAWSYNARRNPPLPDCNHKSCANCQRWALGWRERLLETAA